MKFRQIVLCFSLALIFAATGPRPVHAAGCTAAKSKADRERIQAIMNRGDLRLFARIPAVWVSEPYWRKMSYGQKVALADTVSCAVLGPDQSVYAVNFVVTWPRGFSTTNRIVGVWSQGKLHDHPLPKLKS